MDIFNAHKEDYIELVREIKTKISQVDVTTNVMERNRLLKEIKVNLGEAERILRSMKLTKPHIGSDGEALNMMIDMYRSDLSSLLEEFNAKDREVEAHDRQQLMGSNGMEEDEEFISAQKLTMKLIKTTDTLKDAKGLGDQSIAMGHVIRLDLDKQGKQIEKSMMTLEGMHDTLDQAGMIMTKIWAKMLTTQGIRLLIVVVLILSIASIIYMRFFWSPSRPAPPFNGTL